MNVTRIDGHGCNGCINIRGIQMNDGNLLYYCNVQSMGALRIVEEDCISIIYKIINDPTVKPIWCKYND